MADREKYVKELEVEIKKYETKIKKIEGLLKDPDVKGREKLFSEAHDLQKKLKLAEDILTKLKNAPPGNFEDIKAVSTAIFGQLKENLQGYSHLLSMDPVYKTKDDVVDFSCEKVAQVEKCIKEKPLISAACALGIGFILGTLLTRSK